MNTNPPLPDIIRPNTWLARAWLNGHHGVGRYIGRFAPSPSGVLHQGSLTTALASYLHAYWHGGLWRVRMEDVDTSRCTRALGEYQLQVLKQLGFEFDEPVLWQTERFAAYRAVFAQLHAQNMIYPCTCTRSQMAHDASHGKSHLCPEKFHEHLPIRSWRFRGGMNINWQDESGICHTQRVDDFVIRRGQVDGDDWTYALAVVVDDAAQNITHIVRGADLIEATARQVALQQALDYPAVQYSHSPLLLCANGEKLSKREQAPELDLRNGIDALRHAWQFLGGADIKVADADGFWRVALSVASVGARHGA